LANIGSPLTSLRRAHPDLFFSLIFLKPHPATAVGHRPCPIAPGTPFLQCSGVFYAAHLGAVCALFFKLWLSSHPLLPSFSCARPPFSCDVGHRLSSPSIHRCSARAPFPFTLVVGAACRAPLLPPRRSSTPWPHLPSMASSSWSSPSSLVNARAPLHRL
jgi:hypothetical protein